MKNSLKCWLKKYKRGYAWFDEKANKRVSPIIKDWNVALMANVYGQPAPEIQDEDCLLVRDWKTAIKQAKRVMKNKREDDIETLIDDSYKLDDEIVHNTDSAW